jgi:hypothetical protein
MENKANMIQSTQINSQMNAIPFPNGMFYQNTFQIPPEISFQKNSENKIDNTNINQEENIKETDLNIQKKIRKRAKKNESDIRNYKCSFCDKSYLSYPALYTHCKQKHNTNNHSERGRGRPKKEQVESNVDKAKYDPLTVNYFDREDRKGNTKVEDINECTKRAFEFLYGNETEQNNKQKIKERNMKEYTKIEDHPFLGKFLNDEHDINKNIEDEKIATDFVLMNYLNKMSNYCNEKYYEKLIIFVTLFREHINILNKDKFKDKEFTEKVEAEDIPESSNEFITDFLFPNEEEDFVFDMSKEEAIDLTRNLCNWMYLNNFTCSKLFLLEKEK